MPEPSPDDPPPVAPIRPGREDCCQGSCDPCVFDLYEEALDRYHAELQAWQERNRRREKTDDRSATR
ncbi:MAG TPA: oxidoreductase-like domain-containing protein [Casimicrobiaceae bacterium]